MLEAALYLIPVPLSETAVENVIPEYNIAIVSQIRFFIVENIRSARRFLKKCNKNINIDELSFFTLNGHTKPEEVEHFITPLVNGNPVGVISEAGCPAIADPGADVVAIAQRKHLRIIPLVGPSSIIMSLMASGFNGQGFAFQGYLPIEPNDRLRKFKEMENAIYHNDQTQIFIETPYRNNKLIAEMIRVLPRKMSLCVAADISGENESIKTMSINEWGKLKYNYDKTPTIFLLYK